MSLRFSAMAFRMNITPMQKLVLLALAELVHDDDVPSKVHVGSISRLTNLDAFESMTCVLNLERLGVISLEYDKNLPTRDLVFSILMNEVAK